MAAEATPAHEMSRELVNMLTVAADRGEPVPFAELQEALGVGHSDLEGMLDQLRIRGMASEAAPGEWTGAAPGGGGASESASRVEVSVPDEEELGEPVGLEGLHRAMAEAAARPTVRLTRAIAEALGDEALGQLVKAGLGDTPDGEPFWLEIV